MQNVVSRFRVGLFQGLCWGSMLSGMSLLATPDLIVDQQLLNNVAVQTRTFAGSDCAVVEGCTIAGERRLLLFDVGLVNIGTGDLVIGNPADHPDLFHFSTCHGHYHFDGTAGYELLTTNGATVVTARKQGFCFRDDVMYSSTAGPGKFTCDYQGISIGWEDVYDKSLDCQWLDITGVPCGDYILRVVANPDAILHELDYSNNVAEVLITLECSTNTPPPPPPPPPGCTNKPPGTCTNTPPMTCTNKPPTTCTNKPPKCVHQDDWSKGWDWKKLSKMCNGHYQKNCKIPNCPCKCHIPPGKGGQGNGKGSDNDHKDNGGGKDCNKGDDHDGGGKSNHGEGEGAGKDGGNGGHDKDGGKGQGKDCNNNDDDHGKGGGKG